MKIAAILLAAFFSIAMARAQSFRCVISLDGVQIHTSMYSTYESCQSACSSMSIIYTIIRKQQTFWRCYRT